ncbi:MAG: GNAT family N-acetyltransferase [Gemmatimonadota bacterium]
MSKANSGPRIELARLADIDRKDIIALMNDGAVREHLPLLMSRFDATMCAGFVAAKERMWETHGYRPWALVRGGEFVGWGGLQPEGEDADVGLILKPSAWGAGKRLLTRFLDFGFESIELPSVIALLPPTRRSGRALVHLGFAPDGELEIGDERFLRYRLLRSTWRDFDTA